MKKNKLKILIVLFLAVFVMVTTVTLIANKKETTSIPSEVVQQANQQTGTRNEEGVPQAQIDIGEELAKSDNIQVSNQTVNNVYRSRIQTTERGDVVFYQSPQYELAFLPDYEKFMIYIKEPPADQNIQAAEQQLLQSLEIGANTACELDVEVAVPNYVDTSIGGKNYPLSFCSGVN